MKTSLITRANTSLSAGEWVESRHLSGILTSSERTSILGKEAHILLSARRQSWSFNYLLLHQTHPESSFLHIASRRGRIPSKAHLSLPGKKKVQNEEAETVE